MGKIIILLLFGFLFHGCTKENRKLVRGTVVLQQGCAPGAYLVRLTDPDPKKCSFLCNKETSIISSAIFHCGNAVYILSMPASLAQEGKKVKFSLWTDRGSYCFSSNLAPHHLEVQDLTEE
ncbi:MAG TPA: hypothetical protein VJ499_08300 [Flavisolibacter sp.]|nr:hypothetical protein [Flavisolibacter sp.]